MKCPTCGENTPDDWHALFTVGPGGFGNRGLLEAPQEPGNLVAVDAMHCANLDCRELVVRVREGWTRKGLLDDFQVTDGWYARPRFTNRTIDPLVPEPFHTDYLEAAAILDLSPRMSAVLSRRILADVLEKYLGLAQFNLSDRIDAFIEDKGHPSNLRDNLHYLREIANFGAHTQVDDQAEVIDVTPEAAEWTLEVLSRLFDYVVVSPERDRKMREEIAARIEEAGRKPIPAPDD